MLRSVLRTESGRDWLAHRRVQPVFVQAPSTVRCCFFLQWGLNLSIPFNVLKYSSRFASPPQVCSMYIERKRILPRTIRIHLVFLQQYLRKFEFFFLTAIAVFPSSETTRTLQPCHLDANCLSPETSLHCSGIKPCHVNSHIVQKICSRSKSPHSKKVHDITVFRHGEDFAVLGTRSQIADSKEQMSRLLLVKHIATMGPRPQVHDSKEVRFLNRVLRWVVPPYEKKAPERIELEADPRHADLLIQGSGLQSNSRGVNTPGERPKGSLRTIPSSPHDATSYRSNVNGLAYLAADRVELRFPSKEQPMSNR